MPRPSRPIIGIPAARYPDSWYAPAYGNAISYLRAIEAAGYPVLALPSGAGHDAVMLAQIAPVAMLFIRCAGGISHNPAESVAAEDVAAAIEAMERFLLLMTDDGGR